MALACEDSRMSMDGSDLSNQSPCKPINNVDNNKTTPSTKDTKTSPGSTSPERRRSVVVGTETQIICKEDQETVDTPKLQIEVTRLSWVDIVEEEAEQDNLGKSTQNKQKEESSTPSELVGSESKMSMDDSNSNISMRSTGSGRQIEIDILDSVNVEKYEKLVRDEKIKSPFKRRLSAGDEEDGELDGDNDGHAKFVDAECDGPSQQQEQQQQQNQHKKTKMNENDHGRERFRRESTSSSSGDGSSQSSRKPIEYEKDLSILERRQKQIDYGKNTLGYENYMKQVARDKRTLEHPKTPPKHIKYSRRAWDGLVKVWRKQLHCFDPDAKPDTDA